MVLKILLVLYFFFSLFFLFLFFIFFSLGVYFIEINTFCLEIFTFNYCFFDLSIVFLLDYLSFFFFSFVSFISSIVFFYSKYYIHDSYSLNIDNYRFFFILFFFLLSIFFLVFSGSWVMVLLGWDGLGVVSFLLVVYYNNSSSLDSGLITIFSNRLGDCFFIVSFIFMFYAFRFSFDFLSIFLSFFSVIFISLGCFTKRAQMPFSSWLPAAMAAPTPVSSLVHSSTLVTAGVYLFIRFNFFFSSFYYYVSFFSVFTIFLAGLVSLYEKDFKKVVAISTLRQLGFIIFSISLGFWVFSFFHLLFHAFFKRSLFLSTGRLIHNLSGDQDSRSFGSLGTSFFSKLFFTTSCISLIGFPFSLGFYSKDFILGSFFSSFSNLLLLLFIFSCIFTVAYRLRLIYIRFLNFSSFYFSFSFSEEIFFFVPVLFLYFFCVFLGNFFFFYFFPFLFFSLLECFVGLLIISLGFIFFLFFTSFRYFTDFFFISIGFLYYFSFSLLRNTFSFLSNFVVSYDFTWFEYCTGYGVYFLIKNFLKFGFYFFFVLSSFFSIYILFFCFIF